MPAMDLHPGLPAVLDSCDHDILALWRRRRGAGRARHTASPATGAASRRRASASSRSADAAGLCPALAPMRGRSSGHPWSGTPASRSFPVPDRATGPTRPGRPAAPRRAGRSSDIHPARRQHRDATGRSGPAGKVKPMQLRARVLQQPDRLDTDHAAARWRLNFGDACGKQKWRGVKRDGLADTEACCAAARRGPERGLAVAGRAARRRASHSSANAATATNNTTQTMDEPSRRLACRRAASLGAAVALVAERRQTRRGRSGRARPAGAIAGRPDRPGTAGNTRRGRMPTARQHGPERRRTIAAGKAVAGAA